MNYLNIPGLYNSGPGHWQTTWEKKFPSVFKRVEQSDWIQPDKSSWVETLDRNIKELTLPTVLVAHSLGCMAAIHWAKENFSLFVKGVLLVAPADIERPGIECFKSFCPVPLNRLLIPSIVIASTNDPYASMERCAKWAAYWGSKFICVGDKGHINAESGLENWKEGLSFLKLFEKGVEQKFYEPASQL